MRKLKSLTILAILLPVIAMALSACGGGGGTTSAVTAPATVSTPSVAAKTSVLAVGDADCLYGGIIVETGVDSNKNNILDAEEVSKSQKVCNGTQGSSGTDGLSALVKLTQEATGANCLTGGVRIDSGMDTSKNGVLDPSEITSTSYSCNGAAGSANAGVTWVDVTGTTQQAISNTGYMANSSSNVTITLPVSPSLGDTVQVTGAGTGGWKISQNPGQSIMTNDFTVAWTQRGTSSRDWTSVASSSDGTKLVAGTNNGQLYTSTNSGATWTQRDSVRNWSSVASSSDGTKLVATVGVSEGFGSPFLAGQIYTSTDSGVTWTPRDSARYWSSVASSSDGTKLVVLGSDGLGSTLIYTSTDSGATWTPRDSARNWSSVASSSDGTKLVATDNPYAGGLIYTSTDSGVTWIPHGTVTAGKYLGSVASSSDGTKLVAVYGGLIYTSTDSGATWTPRDSVRNWSHVASSSDGSKLVATVGSLVGGSGLIYTSADSGVTWSPRDSARIWNSVASSSDGTKLVATTGSVAGGGYLYTYQGTFTISGGQYDAVALQCIGNNVFTILSHSGNVVMQ